MSLDEFKKISTLIISHIIIVGVILFSIRLGVTLVFYIKSGSFNFYWTEALNYAIKVGLSAGIPLGIGIWFMSWMKQRKENRFPRGVDPSKAQDHGAVRDRQRDGHRGR